MNLALLKTRWKHISVVLIFLGMVCSVCAQNNPQKINDKLYPLYVKAYNMRKDAASLPLADSLYQTSIAIGDRYGECFALQVKFLHEYYKPNNFSRFDQSLQAYMDKVQSYGMNRFYYYAVSMKTFYYTREKRYLEGFLYLQEQIKIAKSRNNHYGICMLHRMTGVIQHSRGELPQAIASYKQTIDLYKKYGYTRNISREMLAIADCYRLECNYEGVVSAAEEARSYCVSQADRNNVAIYETYGFFMLGRYAEFADRCQYLKNNKLPLDNGYNIINHAFAACSAIYEHRDDDALKIIDGLADISPAEHYRLYSAYYKFKGNYAKSIEYMKKVIISRFNFSDDVFKHDTSSRDRIFRDQRLEAEREQMIERNMQLQLTNAQMTLNNSSLELNRTREAARLVKIEREHNQLHYNHQQLRNKQLSDSIASQRLLGQARERQLRIEHFTQFLIIAVALVLMLLTTIHVLRKRFLVKRLNHANANLDKSINELNVAMDRAQESERLKTLFLQNMGDDLRTPLNAIVGFSRLLTRDDNGLNEDEKKEIAQGIVDNSEVLTTLVNDILDMAEQRSRAANNGDLQTV